ncbi:MAG: DUF927 domain-containing protein [Polyangiaceae bacterium]|nr:DUF927 domain-containing protein [Polyangiaceae bacterium]
MRKHETPTKALEAERARQAANDTQLNDDAPASESKRSRRSGKAKPKTDSKWRVDDRGVFRVDRSTNGDGTPSENETWVSSPLRVVGKARTLDGKGWGRLLEWEDSDGTKHEAIVSESDLVVGDGRDTLKALVSEGVRIARGSGTLLSYIVEADAHARVRMVTAPGWITEHTYVASDGVVYGAGDEMIRYRDERGQEHGISRAGSFDSWRSEVAERCVGNSRLVLALSTVLAGPLLRIAGQSGGGFHFVGGSSSGKTTAVSVAASACGHPSADHAERQGYTRQWDGTKNAISLLGALHNDACLCVDEIGQANTRDVGEVVYTLCNGVERARLTADGKARGSSRWSLLMLSTGEKDVAAAIEEDGKVARAGQEARLASIPADTGKHGMFEALHGEPDGRTFSQSIMRAARANYGHAWPPWLAHLTSIGRTKLAERLKTEGEEFASSIAEHLGDAPSGEVHRVVHRFALCASASELATEAGITGWSKGEATRAVLACFYAWLERREGAGSADARRLFEHVRGVFEAHASTRFDPSTGPVSKPATNRLGWLHYPDGKHGSGLEPTAAPDQAWVPTEVFKKDFVAGIVDSPATAAKILAAEGWLLKGSSGFQKKVSLNTPDIQGKRNAYVFDLKKVLGTSEGGDE